MSSLTWLVSIPPYFVYIYLSVSIGQLSLFGVRLTETDGVWWVSESKISRAILTGGTEQLFSNQNLQLKV
jgi:hypothetical protein